MYFSVDEDNRRGHAKKTAGWETERKSTKVPFREFRLAQLDILIRQSGQRKFASCTFCLKHGPQSSCSHGITTGSIRICKQIGHVKSADEMEFTFASLNCSVSSILKLVTLFEVDVSSSSSVAILDLLRCFCYGMLGE